MITGGRMHPDDLDEIGWAVLVGRGMNGMAKAPTFPQRAHLYDASDGDTIRAACGKHTVAVTDAIMFHPGNWLRCAHCQKQFDKRWH